MSSKSQKSPSKRFSLNLKFGKAKRSATSEYPTHTSPTGASSTSMPSLPSISSSDSIIHTKRASTTDDLAAFLPASPDLSPNTRVIKPSTHACRSPRPVGGSVRIARKRATVAFDPTALDAQMKEEMKQVALEAMTRRNAVAWIASPAYPQPPTGRKRSITMTEGFLPPVEVEVEVEPPVIEKASSSSPRLEMKRSNSLTNFCDQKVEHNRKHASLDVAFKKDKSSEEKQAKPRLLRTSRGLPEGERKRNLVINEIINTEEDYIRDLNVMIDVFRNPMLKQNVATKEEVNAIFSNVQQLAEVNRMLLQDILVRVITSDGNDLGSSFLLLGDYLKLYAAYCGNQTVSREMLERCKHHKAFNAFLAQAHLDTRVKHLILRDYLIKPVQRICKYPLLLRELIKSTDEDHPDYAKLTLALEKIQNVVANVNETKKHEDEIAAIARVISRLKSTEGVQLMVPGRKYLQEGTLLEASKDRRDFHPRHYFLFSDMLILTNGPTGEPSSSKKNCKLEVMTLLAMNEAKMNFNLSASGTDDIANTIEISSSESIYILPFISLELKLQWTQQHSIASGGERKFSC